MRPVDQQMLYDGTPGTRGDCLSACIASVLELEAGSVPTFGAPDDEPGTWYAPLQRWLLDRGLRAVFANGDVILTAFDVRDPIYCVASGPSPRGDWGHSIVVSVHRDGSTRIAHDPHPSRSGLKKIEDYMLLVPASYPHGRDEEAAQGGSDE